MADPAAPAGFVKSKAGGYVPPNHPDAVAESYQAGDWSAPTGDAPQPVTGQPGGQLAPSPAPPAPAPAPSPVATVNPPTPAPPSPNPVEYNKPAPTAPTGNPAYIGPPDVQGRESGDMGPVSAEEQARRAQMAAMTPQQMAELRAQNFARGTGQPPSDPFSDQIRQSLVSQLTQSQVPGADDPVVAGQMNAIEATAERGRRNRQAASAERLAGQGLAQSGAADADLESGYADMQQVVADQQRQVLGAETKARRDQIAQALEQGSALLTADDKNKLTQKLGDLDAQIRREGYGSQERQTVAEIGSRERITGATLATDQWKTGVNAELTRAGFQSAELISSLDNESQERIAKLDADLRAQGFSTQERIAQLDAEVRRESVQSQNQLGRADIDVRNRLGTGQLNLGLLQTLLGNQQAGDALGFNYANLQTTANRDALLAALGGG